MRLAFNASSLLNPLTGIGQYSFHLAKELLTRDSINVEFFYGAFWSTTLRAVAPPIISSALPLLRDRMPYAYELRRALQNWLFYRRSALAESGRKFDVYHEPSIVPLRFDGPTVITVHDLSWLRYPQTHPAVRVRAMNRYFEKGLQQAAAVITDSAFVKQELIEQFGTTSESISVIPLGIDALFKPLAPEQTASTLSKYQLRHGKYFVAVGTLEPRKNLSLALTAFLRLPTKVRDACPLVLIGMPGWHTSALEQQIAPLIAAKQVRQTGYVPRAELAVLTAGALAMVYPSMYEGFGLPVLESMACGVPVICANTSALPEVVGDTGILVDPKDDGDLVHAFSRMIEDQPLRSELSQRARRRASHFTWSHCADRTVAVYQSVSS